jgi:HK97 family phage major capsid protein
MSDNRVFYRNFQSEIKPVEGEMEDREFIVSFSSETPYPRSFGKEVLSHKSGDYDFTYLNSGAAPFLYNHDQNDQRGVVLSSWVDGERGMAKVRLSRNQSGQELRNDILDGVRTSISVAYTVNKMEKSDDSAVVRVHWTPAEISSVCIPADCSVGTNRATAEEMQSADGYTETPENATPTQEIGKMSTETNQHDAYEATEEEMATAVKSAVDAARTAAKCEIDDIRALLTRAGKPELLSRALGESLNLDAVKTMLIDELSEKSKEITVRSGVSANSGVLTDKSKSPQYALYRSVAALLGEKLDGYELEVHEELSRQFGRSHSGVKVPWSALSTRTAPDPILTTDMVPLLAKDLLASQFVEFTRRFTTIGKLNIPVQGGLVGDIRIPRQTSEATGSWVAEDVDVEPTALTTDEIVLSPLTYGCYIDFSRRSAQQLTPAIETLVRADLRNASVMALEDAVFNKDGDNIVKPKGVFAYALNSGTPDINKVLTVPFGTVGGAPTRDLLKQIIVTYNRVNKNNNGVFVTTSLGDSAIADVFSMTPPAEGVAVAGSYVKGFGDNTLFGRGFFVSDFVPGDFTKSSGSALQGLVYGDWSGASFLGNWGGGPELTLSTEAKFLSGGFRIRLLLDLAFLLRKASAFVVVKDIIA